MVASLLESDTTRKHAMGQDSHILFLLVHPLTLLFVERLGGQFWTKDLEDDSLGLGMLEAISRRNIRNMYEVCVCVRAHRRQWGRLHLQETEVIASSEALLCASPSFPSQIILEGYSHARTWCLNFRLYGKRWRELGADDLGGVDSVLNVQGCLRLWFLSIEIQLPSLTEWHND